MKQVIAMRTDLNMRKGKMVAQGSHAAVAVALELASRPRSAMFQSWLDDGMKKVCVGVESLEQLNELVVKARDLGIACHVVTDAGRTEFHGVPTVTCAAIGPALDAAVDSVTGELKLL